MSAFVELKDVKKSYQMGDVMIHASNGIDLQIERGEFAVIVGPSGAGKTTILNLLGGMDTCTSGSILVDGEDISKYREKRLTTYRRNDIGFVFQFYNLIPSLTAEENVALITEISTDPMRPVEALRLVNMEHRKDHFPAQLSGGEQQRVAIARAIAKRPAVLLCDEPTGALDITTGVLVLEAIAKVNRSLGTTAAVITHNSVIASMADRVIQISDGRIHSIERNPTKVEARDLKW